MQPAAPLISWLDLSSDHLARAKEFVRDMQQEGILDELGFGIMQTAIADVLYPATNTVMRAARYLYFIPAIYEHLEREHTSSAQMPRRSREMQNALRDVLMKNENRDVIGSEAGLRLQRFPSNIYWNALKWLGFFTQPLSEAGYHARLDDHYREVSGIQDDDKVVHIGAESPGFWTKRPPCAFLAADGTFDDKTSFALSLQEAEDLRRRYAPRQGAPSNLLSLLVESAAYADLEHPWDAPVDEPQLTQVLSHARALSVIAWGMTLLYYRLLLEARAANGVKDSESDVDDALAFWHEGAQDVLSNWNIDQFVTMPAVWRAVRDGDRRELKAFKERCFKVRGGAELLVDSEARQVVQQRERRIKPYKARLYDKVRLEQWRPRPSVGLFLHGLTFRHGIGTRFVRDIRMGLGRTV